MPDTLASLYPDTTEDLCRSLSILRYLPQKERDAIDSEDFAGPDRSFPIDTQAHLDAAAHLIGHADNPEAVKRKAIAIAKRKGFKLPKAWEEEDGKKGDGDRIEIPVVIRADGSHDPMKGTHSHAHKAFGSQGNDETHEHSHSHDGDASHEHSHEDRATESDITRAEMPTHATLYAPIVRIDKAKYEVEGVATSEAVDTFGTIFSYEASKKAFQRWIDRTANVREMHERKAVGKGVGVYFDDANKQVIVRSRVSRGAPNTWLKIEDGTLNGYSVGATKPTWSTIERDGKSYPYLTDYELTELSYVDSASNPDAQGLVIARADGLTEVIDTTPEEELPPSSPVASPLVARAGARVSGATRDALHEALKHNLHAVRTTAKNCGCDGCQKLHDTLDPDGDGDIDFMGIDDPDGDAEQLVASDDNMDRAIVTALERLLPTAIERALQPLAQRQQALLARLAQIPEPEPPQFDLSVLDQRITEAIERVSSASSLSEVRASLHTQHAALEAVKETVERIAAQPLPGGPVLSGGGYPIDRSMATSPTQQTNGMSADARRAFFDDLQRRGLLTTPELQMAAAEASLVRLPGRMG